MSELEKLFSTDEAIAEFERDLMGWRLEGGKILEVSPPVLPEKLVKRWVGIIKLYVSSVTTKSNIGEDAIRAICSQLHTELAEMVFLNWDQFTDRRYYKKFSKEQMSKTLMKIQKVKQEMDPEIFGKLYPEFETALNYEDLDYVTDEEISQKEKINQLGALINASLHFVYLALNTAKEGGFRKTVLGSNETSYTEPETRKGMFK